MTNQPNELPEELGILHFHSREDERDEAKSDRLQVRKLRRRYDREVKRQRISYIPGRRYDAGGAKRKWNFRGGLGVSGRLRRATSFVAAGAYPFVASGSLGVPGVCMGVDESGGGGFYFDPWELYKAGVIKGMSMVIIGSVGQGKSTCVKCLVARMVLAGRRALIMTDKKGEWSKVADFVGGKSITIGSGMKHRINPLDEGQRPSTDEEGRQMTDEAWRQRVRARRLALLRSIAGILLDRKVTANEDKALRQALDVAVAAAAERAEAAIAAAAQRAEAEERTEHEVQALRTPVIPDVLEALEAPTEKSQSKKALLEGYESMEATLSRMVDGDLQGMFDGPSTIQFDAEAPMMVFNTQALEGLSDEARKIVYACTQTWAEAAVTSRDFGQRVMVYEEGLDSLNDPGSLQRMVAQWKLARAYGIFNILVLHKLSDLDMAGDVGSKTRAQALSLLGDSDIRVIYHQNSDQKNQTKSTLGLTSREWEKIEGFTEGRGLWKFGGLGFVVRNIRTAPEIPIFDTDKQMNIDDSDETTGEDHAEDLVPA
ncbi:DUF87 domain-containing protein [Rothia sp. AR01]|uniref:DUF87 domain-containing protein n=1 Tax=Rothia santali TaxID=2949643 RepID=A0A9X2KHG8_9MICC|nr:DUF87 domain-containing protein [Rothia santali]MCP3425827.1 DUF87 domain-containing protein [Rothia santali]